MNGSKSIFPDAGRAPVVLGRVQCAAVIVLLTCLANGNEFKPEYDKAKLYGPDKKEFARIGVERDRRDFRNAGDRRCAVIDNVVLVLPLKGEDEPRRIRSADGRNLRWLGAASGIALFVAENNKDEVRIGRQYLSAEVRRLDLDRLQWLPSWKVEPESKKNKKGGKKNGDVRRVTVLGAVLARDQAVVVLTYDMLEKLRYSPEDLENIEVSPAVNRELFKKEVYHEPMGYRLTAFDPTAGRSTWTKSFSWLEGPYPPAMLSVGVWWGEDESELELVSWAGELVGEDAILVCAGTKQDLICLSGKDGREHWRKSRLWEYERGYIGPSVFEYFVERFGVDDWTVGLAERTDKLETPQELADQLEAKRTLAKVKKRFDESYEGWIAAGPVVVPGDRDSHIFIATARRRKNELGAGQPPQCMVYELEVDSGEILATSSLPSMIEGRPFKVMSGALIWSCARGRLVRLHHSKFDFSRGFGGPGWGATNDALCRVAWYRQYPMRVPSCWFWADPSAGVAATGPKRLFRPGPAYIVKEDEKVYHFQINVVDLETSLDHDLTLVIPFQGDFPMPKTGIARFTDQTHATQPHLLRIANLAIDGNVLRVIMDRCAKDGRETAVSFDLSAIK